MSIGENETKNSVNQQHTDYGDPVAATSNGDVYDLGIGASHGGHVRHHEANEGLHGAMNNDHGQANGFPTNTDHAATEEWIEIHKTESIQGDADMQSHESAFASSSRRAVLTNYDMYSYTGAVVIGHPHHLCRCPCHDETPSPIHSPARWLTGSRTPSSEGITSPSSSMMAEYSSGERSVIASGYLPRALSAEELIIRMGAHVDPHYLFLAPPLPVNGHHVLSGYPVQVEFDS